MLTKTAAPVLAFGGTLIISAGFGAHHTRTPTAGRHEGPPPARRPSTGRTRAADHALLRTSRLRDRDPAGFRICGGARTRPRRVGVGRGAALRRAGERGSGRATPRYDATNRAYPGHPFGRSAGSSAALLPWLGDASPARARAASPSDFSSRRRATRAGGPRRGSGDFALGIGGRARRRLVVVRVRSRTRGGCGCA